MAKSQFVNWRHSPHGLLSARMIEPGHIALLVASGVTLIAVIALCIIVIRTTASMDRTTTRMGESLQRMDRSANAAERAADAAREAAIAAREAAKETGRIADAVIEMIRKFTQRENPPAPPAPAE
jgi:Na+/phosphate symporter